MIYRIYVPSNQILIYYTTKACKPCFLDNLHLKSFFFTNRNDSQSHVSLSLIIVVLITWLLLCLYNQITLVGLTIIIARQSRRKTTHRFRFFQSIPLSKIYIALMGIHSKHSKYLFVRKQNTEKEQKWHSWLWVETSVCGLIAEQRALFDK